MRQHADFSAPREAPPIWANAVFIHAVCTVASLTIAARAPQLMPGAAWYWLEGISAAVLGAVAGLPIWWLPINLLFVPAVHALSGWHIPAALYLAAFCAMFAVNVAAWRHRVPLFLSSAKVTTALWALLPPHAGFRLLDLGCGTGSVLAAFSRARPDGNYHGIETAPLPFLLSCWRTRTHAAVRVTWGDFWGADFAHYDVVYAYLSPAPMARLWRKARREMRPGSLLVSNTFAVPGVAPAYTLPVGDRMRSTLFVWRM
jgi:SAM-dependent methyltransferase